HGGPAGKRFLAGVFLVYIFFFLSTGHDWIILIVGLCMIFRMSINWSFQILNFLGQDNKFRFMEEYTEDLFVEYMPLIEVEDGFVQSG
ncbi:MAG: hypothetical protein II627_09420, partial [Lachnospiraceae bacterium]|nr:hypothetical protein [Lachnospiraceae bacterium]